MSSATAGAASPQQRLPGLLSVCRARAAAEIRGFARQRESMVFTIAFPPVLLILFGFIFAKSQQLVPGISFASYFVAGMIGSGVVSSSFQNLAITIPIERDAGLLKRLRGTPMPPAAYFVGKIAQVIVVTVAETILLMLIGGLFFDLKLPADGQRWAVLVGLLVIGVASCTLLGIAFSSLAKNGSSAPALVTPIALILQFISGVYFVYTQIPVWLRDIAAVFPLKWLAQGLRYVFLPDGAKVVEAGGQWHLGYVFLVLAGWMVAGLVLCLLTFRWRTADDG